ncbi:MAG: bifunctional 4-hydroxy-2-oxoglutarate aldolase/2-dehydro-3-deoxy-phosphogluconate aldolase [Woeseiaceae bacterium]
MDEQLKKARVVPVVVVDRVDDAVPIAEALREGGLPIIEVTLRTSAALEAIRKIANDVADVIVGAGTVLNAEQAKAAADAGARFIVSPGLHESVVAESRALNLPIYPGIATATEAMGAWNLGIRTVKFFPASQAGGVSMLKALSSVFRDLNFMPTGGITPATLNDYLQLPSVVACGGSWLTPVSAVEQKDFASITRLAAEARALCKK